MKKWNAKLYRNKRPQKEGMTAISLKKLEKFMYVKSALHQTKIFKLFLYSFAIFLILLNRMHATTYHNAYYSDGPKITIYEFDDMNRVKLFCLSHFFIYLTSINAVKYTRWIPFENVKCFGIFFSCSHHFLFMVN